MWYLDCILALSLPLCGWFVAEYITVFDPYLMPKDGQEIFNLDNLQEVD